MLATNSGHTFSAKIISFEDESVEFSIFFRELKYVTAWLQFKYQSLINIIEGTEYRPHV